MTHAWPIYSWGLSSYGLYSYGLHSYNLYIDGLYSHEVYLAVPVDALLAEHFSAVTTEHRPTQLRPTPPHLVTKMKPPGLELAIVARELAPRLAELSFPPDAQHTPGVGHIFADKLSRVYSPTGAGVLTPDLHPVMKTATEAIAPVRDASFYRLSEPASGMMA